MRVETDLRFVYTIMVGKKEVEDILYRTKVVGSVWFRLTHVVPML